MGVLLFSIECTSPWSKGALVSDLGETRALQNIVLQLHQFLIFAEGFLLLQGYTL